MSRRRKPDRRLTLPALITILACGAVLGLSIAMSGYWSTGRRAHPSNLDGIASDRRN